MLHNNRYSRDRIVSEQRQHLRYDNYEEGKLELYTEGQIREVLEMEKQSQPKKRAKIKKPVTEKTTSGDEAETDEDSM